MTSGRQTLRRLAHLLLTSSLVVLTTACGSTVQQQAGAPLTDPAAADGLGAAPGAAVTGGQGIGTAVAGGPGLGGPGTSGAPATGTRPGATGGTGTTPAAGGAGGATGSGAAPGDPTAPAGGAGAAPAAPGAPSAPGAPGPVAMGRGVTDTEIRIGIDAIEGGDELFSSFGIPLTVGDTRGQAEAVMAEINAAGGIAGRQLVPVVHARRADPSKTQDQLDQEACATFTEDNEVFAVISVASHTELYPRCLAAVGTVLLADAQTVDEDLAAAVAGHVVLPSYWVADDIIRIELERLIATGWLNQDTVIAAFYYESPTIDRLYDRVVVPTLAAAGLQVSEKLVATPEGQFQQFASASLQYRAAGVDRVLGVMSSPLVFMTQAESQGYRPGWSVNTGYGPGALLQGAAPAAQLANVAGIGWAPVADVDDARNPGPVSANETRCLEIMAEAGQNLTAATARLFALQVCDYLFFLETALPAAPSLDATGLSQGAASLGDRYASPLGFATTFQPGRPGGGAAVRDLRYSTDCSCFTYTSDPIRVR